MIYVYSLPAIVALLAKAIFLVLSLRAKTHNPQTRLFVTALVFSILLSFAEIMVLQRLGGSFYYGAIAYYVICVPMIALFLHLAVSISVDRWRSRQLLPFYFLFYGYVLVLDGLLLSRL